jgi:nitrogenase molybdenum-iron protein alpha/beta subunit
MEGKTVGSNGKLNIVTGFETYLGNLRVIKRMLKEMGVEYTFLCDPEEVLDTPTDGEFRMYAGGTTQDELKDAPNAIDTLSAATVASCPRPRSTCRTPGSNPPAIRHPDGPERGPTSS